MALNYARSASTAMFFFEKLCSESVLRYSKTYQNAFADLYPIAEDAYTPLLDHSLIAKGDKMYGRGAVCDGIDVK